jgi:hypothetical protein
MLAGWTRPAWDERSLGPRLASLRSIIQHGVTLAILDDMIDDICTYHSVGLYVKMSSIMSSRVASVSIIIPIA